MITIHVEILERDGKVTAEISGKPTGITTQREGEMANKMMAALRAAALATAKQHNASFLLERDLPTEP